jgi:hypothetical protein
VNRDGNFICRCRSRRQSKKSDRYCLHMSYDV